MPDEPAIPAAPDPPLPLSGVRNLGAVATTVALGIVIIYFTFVVFQWRATGSDNVSWARRQELLTGIQALAFTALGAILGTTAQRQVTNEAKARAEQAEVTAQRNE